jgi:hypothetical protein
MKICKEGAQSCMFPCVIEINSSIISGKNYINADTRVDIEKKGL